VKNELPNDLRRVAVTLKCTADKIVSGDKSPFFHADKIRKTADTLFSLADKIQTELANNAQSTTRRPKKVKSKKQRNLQRNSVERQNNIRKAV